MPPLLQNDKNMVLAAIKNNSLAFLYASEDLKNDKEVAFNAFKKNGFLLLLAS